MTLFDARCDAEETKHNLKSSAKNTPSNEKQFKSRIFWWIYNGHLIPGQRVKILHPKISILQV